jgi:hypothetical protein
MTENTPLPDPAREGRAQAAADKAYRKASRPWFKKKRFLLPLIVVLLIIITTAANGGSKDAPVTPAPGVSGPAPAPSTDPSGAPVAAAPPAPTFPGSESGDVVGLAGAALKLSDVTVTSAPIAAGKVTPGFDTPTLCTAVTLANGSKQTVMFSAMDFKLQTPSGAILNTGFLGSAKQLSTGEIAAGGTVTGDVCFDNKSKEAGQFIVLYEPVFSFFSDRAAWINTL